jgi:hypothetical protein
MFSIMKFILTTRGFLAFCLALVLTACGGGGGGTAARDTGATGPAPAPVPTPTPTPVPPPAPLAPGAWTAPSGSTPAAGNYVYLQSDNGDYIGLGRTWQYSSADSVIKVSGKGLIINVGVQGNQTWNGEFQLPNASAVPQAGFFNNLARAPMVDPAVGGLMWFGEGRGCTTSASWVVIDKVVLTDGVMTALDMRFEQHCEGSTAALRGQIHWVATDTSVGQPAAPAAIPASLWQPAASTLPASGNYLYLESRFGDYIGGARTYVYTQANAIFRLNTISNYLRVDMTGDEEWTGEFKGLLSMSQLAPGYYAGLRAYPFNNPVFGGMNWSGEGRGCSTLDGWFVIDSISFSGGVLSAIDLRFEQYCGGTGSGGPLRGKLHWTANDSISPPGPQNPPPAGLWKPDASLASVPGNYVYLVSDKDDWVGNGATQLLTPGNTTISVETNLTAALHIRTGGIGGWDGHFVGMNTLSRLEPGYYGSLQAWPFHNPTRGGMDWSGNGRACGNLTGWFVVDQVSYSLGELTSIDLRFEQRCNNLAPALHGAIHWTK